MTMMVVPTTMLNKSIVQVVVATAIVPRYGYYAKTELQWWELGSAWY